MKRTTCPGPPFRRTGAGCFISGRPPPPRTWPPETWPAGTWCTNPRKPLFLRFLCTKSQAIFWRGAGEDLVHESPQALASPFPLHQVSGHFRRGAGEDLVHESPQALASPFLLHQVSDLSRPGAEQVGARTGPPAGGLFLRLCFSSICKKGIMKWPDWREADSGKGKGQETSNL